MTVEQPVPLGPQASVARAPGRSLPRSSFWLLLGKGFQMGSGFLFWVVAARTASVMNVGIAAAAVSAVLLCTQLGILGTGSAVIVALGRGDPHSKVLDTAFTIVAVTGVLAAAGYLLVGAASGHGPGGYSVQYVGV